VSSGQALIDGTINRHQGCVGLKSCSFLINYKCDGGHEEHPHLLKSCTLGNHCRTGKAAAAAKPQEVDFGSSAEEMEQKNLSLHAHTSDEESSEGDFADVPVRWASFNNVWLTVCLVTWGKGMQLFMVGPWAWVVKRMAFCKSGHALNW
jgi:hypothetical protein